MDKYSKIITLLSTVILLVALSGCRPTGTLPTQSSSAQTINTTLPASLSFFPVALDKFAGQPYPAALTKGFLILENGMLRVGVTGSSDSQLIIWPAGFSVREVTNVIQIVNRDGEIAARVGDGVELGGGQVPAEIVGKYIGKSLPRNVQGPYWLMSEIIKR